MLGVVLAAPGALARGSSDGALTQLAGTAGCISDKGAGGACADGRALDGAKVVAVSTDGKNVYALSVNFSRAIVVFARNPGTGEVTQLADKAGCLGYSGGQGCASPRGLDVPTSLAVSPDGANVYVASAGSSRAIAVFARAKGRAS